MQTRSPLPGYGRLVVLRGAATRTGIYVGACLALTFTAWLLIANRAPALEQFASQRNVIAAMAVVFFGLIPVLRFRREPGRLWASGAVAWLLLSLCYRTLDFFFPGLGQRYSAFQVFMLGAVVYTIASTLCWIGTVVRRMSASESHGAPHGISHSPSSSSNHRLG